MTGSVVGNGQPLVWRRALPFAPEFDLLQGEFVVGEMEPALDSWADASGECFGDAWELRYEAVRLGSRTVEMRQGSDRVYTARYAGWFLGGGFIRTPEREELRWRRPLFRYHDHILIDSQGQVLLRMRPAALRLVRTQAKVEVTPAGFERPDLPALLLLTWFIRVHTESMGKAVFRR